MIKLKDLEVKEIEELVEIAHQVGLEDGAMLGKQELLVKILRAYVDKKEELSTTGILDVINDGYGFLRKNGQWQSVGDVYVSQSQIRRFGLRTGDEITGQVRPPKDSSRISGCI